MQRAMAFLTLLALAGCGSSPKVQFYTLSVSANPVSRRAAGSAPVQVAAVHIPGSLDRREMVSATGPNVVAISDQSRWSAPLGPMTRLVLTQDLAGYLAPNQIVMPDAPAPPATWKIVVTLARFGRQADGRIALIGSWTLLKGNAAKPALRRDVSLQQPAAAGADGQAAGMSALLGQLAARIASAL
jgi:uncharacterized lipoprotein YmbA